MENSGLFEKGYLGNAKLRKPGAAATWTEHQQIEFIKCMQDPIYFTEHYVKIVHVDKGLINFKPRRFQKEIASSVKNNRFTLVMACRQSGKCAESCETINICYNKTGHKTKITIGEFYELCKAASNSEGMQEL